MITGYIGKMRSGKTYAMTREVLKRLNSGEIVFVNYFIDWDPLDRSKFRIWLHRLGLVPLYVYPKTNLHFFIDWEEVVNYTNVTVALDEGWQYFDSYQKLSIDKRMRLYQSGKREINFLYTVQRYMMADINLRWSTDVFIESKLFNIPFCNTKLIRYKYYDLEEDSDGAKIAKVAIEVSPKGMKEVDLSLKTRYIFTSNKIFNAYDTTQDIYADARNRSLLAEKIDVRGVSTGGTLYPQSNIWASMIRLIKGKNS